MPRTSLGLKTLKARPKRKDIAGSNEDVDGAHLLAHFGAFLHEISSAPITDDARGRYVRVADTIARGRSLTVVARTGSFGEPGEAYNVDTNELTHRLAARESSTAETRMTLWAPPSTPVIVVGIEYKWNSPSCATLIDEFRKRMLDRHQNFWFPYETVMETDAWSASGDLAEVSVVQHRQVLNLSDGIDSDRSLETVRGSVVHTAVPPKGQTVWPRRVWDRIRNRDLDAATFIGLRRDGDALNPDDEVFVTVRRDGREKKFALGTDGAPAVRAVLSEDGQPALSPDEFHTQVDENVRGFYQNLDLEWKSAWAQGATATEWLAHRW